MDSFFEERHNVDKVLESVLSSQIVYIGSISWVFSSRTPRQKNSRDIVWSGSCFRFQDTARFFQFTEGWEKLHPISGRELRGSQKIFRCGGVVGHIPLFQITFADHIIICLHYELHIFLFPCAFWVRYQSFHNLIFHCIYRYECFTHQWYIVKNLSCLLYWQTYSPLH